MAKFYKGEVRKRYPNARIVQAGTFGEAQAPIQMYQVAANDPKEPGLMLGDRQGAFAAAWRSAYNCLVKGRNVS